MIHCHSNSTVCVSIHFWDLNLNLSNNHVFFCFVGVSLKMEFHKNILITVVTVLIITSCSYTIFICNRCKKYRKESDIIFPLLMSVFAAGLLRGISCTVVCVLCWAELQHLIVLLQIQFVLLWLSINAQYWSMAMLSAIKSLSVLKPFLYLQSVTRTKMLMITLLMWFLSLASAVPMILPIPMGFSHVVQLPLPGPNGDQLGHLFDVLVYPYFLVNIPRVIIFISSIILVILTVRHKLQMKQMINIGYGEKTESADVVIRAIWSSKGVLAISIVSIILCIPVITVTRIPPHMVKHELRFYFYSYWFLASDTFFYSLCVIFTSPTLLKWIKSCGRVEITPVDLQ